MKNGRGPRRATYSFFISHNPLTPPLSHALFRVIIHIHLFICVPLDYQFARSSVFLQNAGFSLPASPTPYPLLIERNDGGTKRDSRKDFERDVRSPRNSQESQLTPAGSRDLRGGEDKQDAVKEERKEGGRRESTS